MTTLTNVKKIIKIKLKIQSRHQSSKTLLKFFQRYIRHNSVYPTPLQRSYKLTFQPQTSFNVSARKANTIKMKTPPKSRPALKFRVAANGPRYDYYYA